MVWICANCRSRNRQSEEVCFTCSFERQTSTDQPLVFRYTRDRIIPVGVTHIRVDDSITELPARVFENRIGLLHVDLPESLRVINEAAFANCHALQQLEIPSTVIQIRRAAFFRCENMKDMSLPDGLVVLGARALAGCFSIPRINVPKTINDLQVSTFAGCFKMTSISLPENIKEIRDYAFASCVGLTHFKTPSSVKVIGDFAFSSCLNLASAELPKILKRIGIRSFQGCKALRNICIPPTTEEVATDAFDGCNKLRHVFPDHANLVNALKTRFDSMPVHKLCYHQTYLSPERTLQELEKILKKSKDLRSPRTDAFGMTPLHILSLSSKSNFELCKRLVHNVCYFKAYRPKTEAHENLKKAIEKGPNNVWALRLELSKKSDLDISKAISQDFYRALNKKDKFGSDPARYFLFTSIPEQLESAMCIIEAIYEHRIKRLGLKQWQDDCLKEIEKLRSANSRLERKSQIERIGATISKYRTKEKLSVLELAFWKAKIEEVEAWRDESDEPPRKRAKIDRSTSLDTKFGLSDREFCRKICGVDIVIPHIVPFLRRVKA